MLKKIKLTDANKYYLTNTSNLYEISMSTIINKIILRNYKFIKSLYPATTAERFDNTLKSIKQYQKDLKAKYPTECYDSPFNLYSGEQMKPIFKKIKESGTSLTDYINHLIWLERDTGKRYYILKKKEYRDKLYGKVRESNPKHMRLGRMANINATNSIYWE